LYEKGYQGYNLQEELYDFREDKNARKRKKYRYRIDEAKVRWKGFRLLGLMPKGVIYVLKPLIVGLIPYPVLVWLRGEKDRFVP
ncbi:MAG: glycosyltransferase family 2 protein, partial [Eubacterium sp.]|nr:glycosyltransferase family 2 protein [Eubacterium sp.]